MTDDIPVTAARTASVPEALPLPFEAKLLPLIGWATFFFGGGLIGLIIAYVDRGNAPGLVADNYTYMIRTFWLGCAYAVLIVVLSGLSAAVHIFLAWLVFFLLGGALAIWFLVRCIKGPIWLMRGLALPDPMTWLV